MINKIGAAVSLMLNLATRLVKIDHKIKEITV